MVGPDGTSKEIHFRMTAGDCLSQRVSEFFNFPLAEEAGIQRENFHQYGRMVEGHFVPYWLDTEPFEAFSQREAGLNRAPGSVITEAVDGFFFRNQLPIANESLPEVSGLTSLFTPSEVESIQAHAIMIEDENWHALALAFQESGDIPTGSVQRVESPLNNLHESADPEIAEFFEEVRASADAVYGVPKYYPEPERDPEIVDRYRNLNVIYSEPEVRTAKTVEEPVWAATVQGEIQEAKSRTPVFSLEETVQLLVTDVRNNHKLTASLLNKRNLLRYWIGSKMMDLQRKKMDDFKHTFTTVCYRKMVDDEGRFWRFENPAKKPQ